MKLPMYYRAPCPTCGHVTRAVNGRWLRAKREAAGLNQRAFGAIVGLSSPYLSDIERNRRACPADLLEVYRALGA